MPRISQVDDAYRPIYDELVKDTSSLTRFRGLDVALDSAIRGIENVTSRVSNIRESLFREIDRVDIDLRATLPEQQWKAERTTTLQIAEASRDALLDDLKANRELGELMAAKGARPKIDPDDLALRDELKTLLQGATPEQIADRTLNIAQSGRRDLGALLTSPYGKTLLTGMGVLEGDPDLHDRMFDLMASTAVTHGKTEKERTYGQAYEAFKTDGNKVLALATAHVRGSLSAVEWNMSRQQAAQAAYANSQHARVAAARRAV